MIRPESHEPLLGASLDAFMQALALNEATLASWLRMPAERLPRLAGCPLPRIEDPGLARACERIAETVGCDPWLLTQLVRCVSIADPGE